MAIPRATEIFEIRMTVAENELPFWNCSRPAMNPDKNEDANQINLGRKCREVLFNGLGLDAQVWILFTRKRIATSPLAFSKG
jgi:hypothetical protein